MGTADLHIHTTYSKDATTTVRGILKQASECTNLDVIAITDHDEIRGALEACDLASQYSIEVIPGIEISTREGHLVALDIKECVPRGLPLVETLLRVGEQGGFAIASHPGNPLPDSLSMEAILKALVHPEARLVLKGIEVSNYFTTHHFFNRQALQLARYLFLAQTGSSDSHIYHTVGAAYTQFQGRSADDLRKAIHDRTTSAKTTSSKYPIKPLIDWVWHISLRRFGWVTDNVSPTAPVALQKRQAE
jgi:predicted metal-dependent phosphoesterase TrpH